LPSSPKLSSSKSNPINGISKLLFAEYKYSATINIIDHSNIDGDMEEFYL
jgi:hypothetical protein